MLETELSDPEPSGTPHHGENSEPSAAGSDGLTGSAGTGDAPAGDAPAGDVPVGDRGAADGNGTPARRTRRPRRAATRAAGPPPADLADTPLAPPAVASPPVTEAPSAIPPATFQPPPVIFQSPAAGTPVERARPAAGGSGSGSAGGSGGADEPAGESARDAGDGPGRRRRRRARGRGHDGDGDAGTEPADGQEPSGRNGATAAGRPDDAPEDRPGGGEREDGLAGARSAGAGGPEAGDEDDAGDGQPGTSRRRRRRRRRGSAAEADQPGSDDPPNTVVHVRVPRAPAAEEPVSASDVKAVRGSTRLEAKRQRRREGRESGRRRPPVISEAEFLARRESVERVMVVRQQADRTQIAVLEDGVLVEHYVDKATHQSMVGNVYLGKVQNVLPSMEAAFVDVGKGRNAVLYAGEVNFDASGLEGESKRIESALKSGQSVLVQVTKDPVGHKGARLTSQVSLPGRYLVYVPGGSMMGISRKLPDKERTRLKQILKQVMPEGAGVIVRTAAEGAAEDELSRDVSRLAAQWEAIERKSKSASAPQLLYSEPDLTIRVVRDIFNEDFASLVVAGDDGWDLVEEYVRYVAPHLAGRLTHWTEDKDVFARYRVDEQLAKALERKVWLPSGGSLVIDNTEAMTVVDVNTGKFTGQGGNLEETVTRNNLEAAEEIVRQLRLRDVGGIIVIDFIDMVLESNRELVLRRMLECLARDRTKHQVAEVTSLGLVQMTRKRVGSGLLEAFSEPCDCCNGRGRVISLDPAEPGNGRSGRAGAEEGRPAAARGENGRSDRNGRQDKDGRSGRGDRNGRSDRAAEPGAQGEPGGDGRPGTDSPARAEAAPERGERSGGRRRRRSSSAGQAVRGDTAVLPDTASAAEPAPVGPDPAPVSAGDPAVVNPVDPAVAAQVLPQPEEPVPGDHWPPASKPSPATAEPAGAAEPVAVAEPTPDEPAPGGPAPGDAAVGDDAPGEAAPGF